MRQTPAKGGAKISVALSKHSIEFHELQEEERNKINNNENTCNNCFIRLKLS